MAKPIIKEIEAFDASQETYVEFLWSGNAAYNNRMVIFDADTMLPVYDHIYSTNYYKLNHKIPSGILTNGKKYAVHIAVIDKDKNVSDFSDKYYFWVLASPSFYFEGLSTTSLNTIDSSVYVATLHYSQTNNVALASYQFFLYNITKELLDSSDIYQDTTSALTYTYRSLANNETYYIRATGFNARNVPVDTGYVQLKATYVNPNLYTKFYTNVDKQIGIVNYYTNIISIESDRDTDEYTYEDGCVDLTEDINSVRYSHNFVIPGDAYTISVRMKNAYKDATILKVQTGTTDKLVLSSHIDDSGLLRYKLTVYGTSDYVLYSGGYIFDQYDMVTVHIRRDHGLYGLYVFVTEMEGDPPRNMWFMTSEPPYNESQYGDIWIDEDYPIHYIDKDSVVRFYQNNKPTNAELENIWIGN